MYACMYVCMYVCMLHSFRALRFAHLKPRNLIIHVIVKACSSRIGTLVVVYNRSVIERQSHVRFVVAKDITAEGLVPSEVLWQKQCHPAPHYYLILFESTPCKNSDTSCLESRRKVDGVKFIRNINLHLQANINDTIK